MKDIGARMIRLKAIEIAVKILSPNADERALFSKAEQIVNYIVDNKVDINLPER